MSPIYTRRGDLGRTTTADGRRISKSHPVIDAVGAVDELNAHIGLLCTVVPDTVALTLHDIQRQLFIVGAYLSGATRAVPTSWSEATARLEAEIDRIRLPPFTGFILPGGCEAAARAHVCRTVCRRAERCAVAVEGYDAVAWLNRLSDYFYAVAVDLNRKCGREEIK